MYVHPCMCIYVYLCAPTCNAGKSLIREAAALHKDLIVAVERSVLTQNNRTCLPMSAGWTACPGVRSAGYKYPSLDMCE